MAGKPLPSLLFPDDGLEKKSKLKGTIPDACPTVSMYLCIPYIFNGWESIKNFIYNCKCYISNSLNSVSKLLEAVIIKVWTTGLVRL